MKRPACFIACLILLFLIIYLQLRPPDPFSDDRIRGRTITVSGTVDDKYSKNSSDYLIIKDTAIISGLQSAEKGKVIVKLKESKEDLSRLPVTGSGVCITGKGMIFSEARNPGNYDLAAYEMVRGIDYELYDAVILSEKTPGFNPGLLDEYMCRIREKLKDTACLIYGEEDSGIVCAMLLGDRTGLSDEIKDGYRRSGMSHILCISALHISLLGAGILKLLRKIGMNKTAAYILSFIMITLYGRLTGSGISTIRALITFALIMTADIIGRTPDILSSLSAAGTVILIIQPLYVLDSGFVLSFTSVCGIGILGPVFKRLMPVRGAVADALKTSVSITVFMLPVTLYYFFGAPLYSVLINLIVIPLLAILLVSALISLVTGCFIPLLGDAASIPARVILSLYRSLTGLNDRLPFSLVTSGRPEIWQITVFYLIIAGLIIYDCICKYPDQGSTGRARGIRLKRAIWITGIIFGVLILTVRLRPFLSITMIDTGQGDCHMIEIDKKTVVMIDCGSSDIDRTARYRVVPYVRSRGYDRIDYAIVTHTDEDHISGYKEIFSAEDHLGIRIKTLILPDIENKDDAYHDLAYLAADCGTSVVTVKAGDEFELHGLKFECLNPVEGMKYSDPNSASVCLLLSGFNDRFRALYTGDTQNEGEEVLNNALSGSESGHVITLLKCAHHGSAYSTGEDFLSIARPAVTFISAGMDNSYGHPSKALLSRLDEVQSRVFVTSKSGAVRMDVYWKKIKIHEFIKTKEDRYE